MTEPRITYTPRLDATPEGEAAVLAAIYRFLLFGDHDSKEAAGDTGGEERTREEKHVSQDRTTL